LLEFHGDLSSYKNATSLYFFQNKHFFAAILRSFGPGRLNFNTWDLSAAYVRL